VKPYRILVTASRGQDPVEYFDALREAGAEPVRIEPGGDALRALNDAHGLLVTGGVDVDPASYGAPPSPLVTGVEPERDRLETELLRAARERGMPTLCICRGLQIANVAFGGTLIPDIPAALGNRATVRHEQRDANNRTERGLIAEHVVRIEPGSRLAAIVGTTELVTGARHHQSVDVCAADLRVVGRTADRIVEALEARFASVFWLAVQWHPESTRALDDGASRAIFRAFVEASAVGRPSALHVHELAPESKAHPGYGRR
jgi:putative glutamine amidotransferase